MRWKVLGRIGGLVLVSLCLINARGQREAKVEGNLKSLASGETKTGSGPDTPGAGLQGTRNELYKIQQSDTLELTFAVHPLGVAPTGRSSPLPRERFQDALPQLQPRLAWRTLRTLCQR